MPGFSDNLRRAREAAGLSPEDLACRVGAAPIWLAHLEAIGAALPELPHLVRLAEALGCPIDDLLAGGDDEFDHPRRRHAALIAARLGRISAAQARVSAARARGELTRLDEACLDEPAMLHSIYRCRGWVTAPTADLGIATSLERELDDHLTRLNDVMQRVDDRATASRAKGPVDLPSPPATLPQRANGSAASRAAVRAGMTAAPVTSLAPVVTPGSAGDPAPAAAAAAARTAAILRGEEAAGVIGGAAALARLSGDEVPGLVGPQSPRLPGRRTPMWSRPGPGADAYVCEMLTVGTGVALELRCGDRTLATHACRNLDEAFSQSSAWKRIPDPETHFAGTA